MPSSEPTEYMKRRGAALKAIRERQGLTQQQVAAASPWADSTYASREQGSIGVKEAEYETLAKVLHVSVSEIRDALDAADIPNPLPGTAYRRRGRPRKQPLLPRREIPPDLENGLLGIFPPGLADGIGAALVVISNLRPLDQQVAAASIEALARGFATSSELPSDPDQVAEHPREG